MITNLTEKLNAMDNIQNDLKVIKDGMLNKNI
ncbi:hypothetical protein LGL55_24910 [Clostridium tagluense]|nr:hypothetical protein [Clostridium tagluense]MCB2318824.1 hypothetical protein [Clostridium tagluense]MCB2324016.1 hypothetical protein [Clostridium tagluense]MCB2328864.1 hypothetical protein [Clostridium tagluense]MCB2333715.1 hypothetical protein [Clostridium tagluense]